MASLAIGRASPFGDQNLVAVQRTESAAGRFKLSGDVCLTRYAKRDASCDPFSRRHCSWCRDLVDAV